MLAMYAVIMAAGSQQATWDSLLAGDWSQTPATVPILLLTLVSGVCLLKFVIISPRQHDDELFMRLDLMARAHAC